MPRPTKLTTEVGQRICDLVAIGCTRETAARACGITATTVYRWMRRGEDDPEGPFGEFRQSVKKADALFVVRSLEIIQGAAADGTWQAAAWLLERRFPDRWGRRRASSVPATSHQLVIEAEGWFSERLTTLDSAPSGT